MVFATYIDQNSHVCMQLASRKFLNHKTYLHDLASWLMG